MNNTDISQILKNPQELEKLVERERIRQEILDGNDDWRDIYKFVEDFSALFNMDFPDTYRYLGVVTLTFINPIIERYPICSLEHYDRVKCRALSSGGFLQVIHNGRIIYDSNAGISLNPFDVAGITPMFE